MAKLFYFDIETTGVSIVSDSIYQMAGIVEIDGVVKETFDIKMRPKNFDDLPDDYVTPVGNVTKAMMAEYGSQEDGYRALKNILDKYVSRFDAKDKFFMVGYNCQSFDNQFLRQFFLEQGDQFFGSYFWSVTLDVMVLVGEKLIEERPFMPNFKLETVAEYLGVAVDGVGYHEAMTDINTTRELYLMLKTL